MSVSWPLSFLLALCSIIWETNVRNGCPAEHRPAHARTELQGSQSYRETRSHTEKQTRNKRELIQGASQPSRLTKNWIFFMLKVLELRRWSARRPGVAITTCGFRDSSSACATMSAVEGEMRPGGRDEQGPPAPQQPLSPLTHSANDDAVLQAQGLPQHTELLSDLVGQLSAGDKSQPDQWAPVPVSHPPSSRLLLHSTSPMLTSSKSIVDRLRHVSAGKIQAHIWSSIPRTHVVEGRALTPSADPLSIQTNSTCTAKDKPFTAGGRRPGAQHLCIAHCKAATSLTSVGERKGPEAGGLQTSYN